jgi:hypothetical protein
MLFCINAAGEILCPLIVASDKSTLGVFRDGIEDGMDLKVHVGKSAYVDAYVFRGYLCDIRIPKIEEFWQMSEMIDTPAVLLMDDWTALVPPATIQLLSDHHVKAITVTPHASAISHMLGLVFFGAFEQAKKHLVKNPAVLVPVDQAPRTFKACESAVANYTVRSSFMHGGFIYEANSDGACTIGFNETKVRDWFGFKEVRNSDFPIDMLNPPQRDTPWGFLNWEAFQS